MVILLVIMYTKLSFLILYLSIFRETQITVGRKYTTLYLPLLELACILLKIEVYNAGLTTWGRDRLPQFFLQKVHFCYFYSEDVLLFQT